MIGQLTAEEFKDYLIRHNGAVNYVDMTAITKYGRSTINYWVQHQDKSWSNHDCKTTQIS